MESKIDLYIGSPVSNGSEQWALRELCADLRSRSISALLLVNFEAGGRQIDCVVVRDRYALLLDFKQFNGPIRGGKNGRWILRDHGGSERPYEGENPYQQVVAAKFALSDELKRFHRSQGVGVAPTREQFVRLMDAAVCVFPEIDTDSQLSQGDFKCRIWSYRDVLAAVTESEEASLTPLKSLDGW